MADWPCAWPRSSTSYLGARVGMALPVKPARRLFGLFLLLGLFFLARTLYRVELYGWR